MNNKTKTWEYDVNELEMEPSKIYYNLIDMVASFEFEYPLGYEKIEVFIHKNIVEKVSEYFQEIGVEKPEFNTLLGKMFTITEQEEYLAKISL